MWKYLKNEKKVSNSITKIKTAYLNSLIANNNNNDNNNINNNNNPIATVTKVASRVYVPV